MVAYHDVRPGRDPAAVVPIGRPTAGARLHVLDDRGRPVPDGVPGELHIGGAGVALGYLHRPELTAERFGPDPFCDDPGARLYRSGDLVVRRPDAELVFLGRADTQIKIRGYRVELGEIEAALRGHPDVEAAAVRTWSAGASGEPTLGAWVVPRPGTAFDPDALAAHLRQVLPAYMQPRPIMAVERLPLTPTGKVDRRALPEPRLRPEADRARPAWSSPGPLADMIGLWETVLETGSVGPDDHFFDIGGHSLRALVLLAAVRDEFRVDLRMADLASADTPRTLLAVVEDRGRSTPRGEIIELAGGVAGLDPVLFIPGGVAIHFLATYRRLAQHLELDRPALSFEPPGVAPGTVPRPSVPAAARWYWSRIQERFPDGPLRLVGHSLGAIMALEVARLARAAGRPIGALDLLDPRLPARSPTFGSRLRIEVSAARRRGRAELAPRRPARRPGRGALAPGRGRPHGPGPGGGGQPGAGPLPPPDLRRTGHGAGGAGHRRAAGRARRWRPPGHPLESLAATRPVHRRAWHARGPRRDAGRAPHRGHRGRHPSRPDLTPDLTPDRGVVSSSRAPPPRSWDRGWRWCRCRPRRSRGPWGSRR